MEKLPPSETSKLEKNSRTAMNSKDNLKIINFKDKKKSEKAEAKEDILDLLGVVADDVVNVWLNAYSPGFSEQPGLKTSLSQNRIGLAS